MPDRKRIEAILNFPAPKNQRQLRKFLGITNFHQRFIINYANYVAPLLELLRKGCRWQWSADKQTAFETLREMFAHSIHLVHPDHQLPYIINSDASSRAIGAILMQHSKDGNINIVSTASRVLTPAEQRYTTCELELLAIVYALSKFRIYIYGSKVILNTDNRALTFLDRCAITSNRVARWSLEIQSYDLVINHVKGVDNYLADVLSRNPAGLTASEIRNLNKPATLMVNKIELNIDKEVCKELKNLAAFQKNDPKLLKIRDELVSQTRTQHARYKLQNDVLYCKDAGPSAT